MRANSRVKNGRIPCFLVYRLSKNTPQVPSFNNKAAKITEPATGASKWALGNHTWAPNKGTFTRNPNSSAPLISLLNFRVEKLCAIKTIPVVPWAVKIRILTKRGREASRVYSNINFVADTRSGWYPHPIISIVIGKRDSSKVK